MRRTILCFIALTCAGTAAAADDPVFTDRFALTLGTYWMTSDTTMRLDDVREIDIGTEINLEDTFNLDEETVFRLEGTWRFAPRHKVLLMYFDSSRTSSASASREIEFGEATFPVNAEVRVDFDFQIIELAYEYAFWTGDDFEVGASFGIHNVDFATELSASLAGAGGSASRTVGDEAKTDAPLPVIGLRGALRLGESDFYLNAHVQYFALSYGGFDGRLLDLQGGVLWQFSRHVGVGAAYNVFDTSVDIDDGSFAGTLSWKYQGAQLFFRGSF